MLIYILEKSAGKGRNTIVAPFSNEIKYNSTFVTHLRFTISQSLKMYELVFWNCDFPLML